MGVLRQVRLQRPVPLSTNRPGRRRRSEGRSPTLTSILTHRTASHAIMHAARHTHIHAHMPESHTLPHVRHSRRNPDHPSGPPYATQRECAKCRARRCCCRCRCNGLATGGSSRAAADQVKSSQVKSSQVKSSQVRSSQVRSSQVELLLQASIITRGDGWELRRCIHMHSSRRRVSLSGPSFAPW